MTLLTPLLAMPNDTGNIQDEHQNLSLRTHSFSHTVSLSLLDGVELTMKLPPSLVPDTPETP